MESRDQRRPHFTGDLKIEIGSYSTLLTSNKLRARTVSRMLRVATVATKATQSNTLTFM